MNAVTVLGSDFDSVQDRFLNSLFDAAGFDGIRCDVLDYQEVAHEGLLRRAQSSSEGDGVTVWWSLRNRGEHLLGIDVLNSLPRAFD